MNKKRDLKLVKTTTARFSEVVAACGEPVVLTLWQDPKNDKPFQAALKANRVMTIHHANVGNAKDYGTVGYKKLPESILMLFPRSLSAFQNQRIVGIKWDLVKG